MAVRPTSDLLEHQPGAPALLNHRHAMRGPSNSGRRYAAGWLGIRRKPTVKYCVGQVQRLYSDGLTRDAPQPSPAR